jgi:hypothetical protein
MSRFLITVFALAIPALCAAQPATSQAITDVRTESMGRLGPFYLTPRVLLKEVGVDSNVFNEAGEQKSDFTVTLAPTLDIAVPVARRALFRTALTPELVWYSQYDSERSMNPHVTLRGEIFLSRITVFAEGTRLNTRQRPNHDVDVRLRHTEGTAAGGFSVSVTPQFSVEIMGRLAELQYESGTYPGDEHLQRTLNRESRSLQLTARHRLTPLTTVATRYEAREDRFELSPGRDSDSYRIMPGVEFAPQALLKGTAYVGYRKFTPLHAQVLPEFAGLVAELGLSSTVLGSTIIGATYRRDLTYSASALEPFFVENTVGVSVRRALGQRFDLLLSGDRHRYQYETTLTVPPDVIARLDSTWVYGASLGVRVGRDGRVGFGATYVQRESTLQSRTYDNLRFGGSFSYGF